MHESMKNNMNEHQVMTLVSEILGIRLLSATRMTFGHNNIVYDVTLLNRNVIVRTNKDAHVFAKTEQNLTLLAQLGLPVPHVLAADLTQKQYSSAYMILEKIPGCDLRYELSNMTHAQMTRVAEHIVSFQQKVATLPTGKGFGYVPIGEQGTFSSWIELLQFEMSNSTNDTYDGILSRWKKRLAPILIRFEPYLAQIQPICFLDDVTTKNVIVLNGELQGLVDFDCVCYGDPLWMIGLTKTAVLSDIGIEALFYVEELCRLWKLADEQYNIVNFYAALHALNFIGRLAIEENSERVERMTNIVEQWITSLEGTIEYLQKEPHLWRDVEHLAHEA